MGRDYIAFHDKKTWQLEDVCEVVERGTWTMSPNQYIFHKIKLLFSSSFWIDYFASIVNHQISYDVSAKTYFQVVNVSKEVASILAAELKEKNENVVLELARLDVIPDLTKQFEINFQEAQKIISSMSWYISHDLKKCIENPNRYVLLVKWDKLESHTEGFRKSEEYQEWKKLLHHFYDPFPTVEHYN